MAHAIVLTEFGGPDVLRWQEVAEPQPARGRILIRVRAAGVGPTDLHIRRGDLVGVFPQGPGSVLGFEASGIVVALGEGVSGVSIGDEVAALLPDQGGYAELAVVSTWVAKPPSVSWSDAAALPASAEVAVGLLREVRAAAGETLVVLGAAGSVGQILVQLAAAQGLRVIGLAGERDGALVRSLGGEPVAYGQGAFERVAAVADSVDAVIDAAGRGGIREAIDATGDATRVITLVDPTALALGARFTEPGPQRAPDALDITMPMLASGALRLKARRDMPLSDAAEAHRALESGSVREKVILLAS
ncbi:NADP-dependent oxidoreductase [Microbacterium ulmi]|uniref:NADP-dependent oxidoreductase n=1 Tax=Microbacterium ulmi TaxID=179095 RepID=A0A7Y2Q0D6_9MICO|nr:NADP-dependent oxidoreductase [Microbacterium ulmi]NII71213.1 NADPH:quinone reductase-like Zn-dependent oxidoreductase [Microbacterium ulmi]NNH02518.1 NADP-dependent oxidoreductase [Microbacterium ulmi]